MAVDLKTFFGDGYEAGNLASSKQLPDGVGRVVTVAGQGNSSAFLRLPRKSQLRRKGWPQLLLVNTTTGTAEIAEHGGSVSVHTLPGSQAVPVGLDANGDWSFGTDKVYQSAGGSPPPPPPVAEFSGDVLSGEAPHTVNFMDASTGSINSRLWQFGDRTTSTETNPTKEYTAPGDYTVSLTVMGDGGNDTETKVAYISVMAPAGTGTGGTTGGTGGSSDVTPSFTPHRSSGIAPLYVSFDASASSSVNTALDLFLEGRFAWYAGEGGLGNYRSGKPKGLMLGPIAAHVYGEDGSGGTFSPMLDVEDRLGEFSILMGSDIVVTSADAAYSGTDTICVARDTDFTGAPAGALLVVETTAAGVMSHVAPDKRVLLRKGDSWTDVNSSKLITGSGGTVGAFGTGAKPILSGSAAVFNVGGVTQTSDWRFIDIDHQGTGTFIFWDNGNVNNEFAAQDILVLRCEFDGQSTGEHFGLFINGSSDFVHSGLAFVDCTVRNSAQNSIFLVADDSAILGCDVQTTDGGHCLRISLFRRGVIQHNYVSDAVAGAGSGLHLAKIHAPSHDGSGFQPGANFYTEKVVQSDNEWVGTDGSDTTMVAIGPQNPGPTAEDERIRRYIVERDHFRLDESVSTDWFSGLLTLSCVDSVVRSCIFDGTRGWLTACTVGSKATEPPPVNVWVLGNTFYVNGSGSNSGMDCIVFDSDTSDCSAVGNLAYGPGTDQPMNIVQDSGTDNTVSNNTASSSEAKNTDPLFVNDPPSNADDFDVGTGSPAIDAGPSAPFDGLKEDFLRRRRPTSGSMTRGAFEFAGAAGEFPTP